MLSAYIVPTGQKYFCGCRRSINIISLTGTCVFHACSSEPSPRDLKMICYAASPNPYISDHTDEIKQIYDGLFYSIGSWDSGILQVLGTEDQEPADRQWKDLAKDNMNALRRAGVTENFLTVSFGSGEAYPSPQTILADSFTLKMKEHFTSLGRVAKQLGFKGICFRKVMR